MLLFLAAMLIVSACAAPSALVMSDAALNPEPGAPLVTVTVTAGDDDTALPGAEVTAGSAQLIADETGRSTSNGESSRSSWWSPPPASSPRARPSPPTPRRPTVR